MADGSTTNELGKTFEKAISEAGLKSSPHGVRTLYSLRHTYITWQLMSGNVSMEVLAKQCGTSIAMIEQHYSHVTPKMYSKELSGVDLGKDGPVVKEKSITRKRIIDTKRSALFKEWHLNYKQRGCI